jgi:hypothetical protein
VSVTSRSEGSLALALVEAIASDPRARDRLRALLALDDRLERLAYTVPAPAEETGLSPKAVRGAIQRGELNANRRGDGPRAPYIIAAEDARRWLLGAKRRPTKVGTNHNTRRVEAARPLTSALADLTHEAGVE